MKSLPLQLPLYLPFKSHRHKCMKVPTSYIFASTVIPFKNISPSDRLKNILLKNILLLFIATLISKVHVSWILGRLRIFSYIYQSFSFCELPFPVLCLFSVRLFLLKLILVIYIFLENYLFCPVYKSIYVIMSSFLFLIWVPSIFLP